MHSPPWSSTGPPLTVLRSRCTHTMTSTCLVTPPQSGELTLSAPRPRIPKLLSFKLKSTLESKLANHTKEVSSDQTLKPIRSAVASLMIINNQEGRCLWCCINPLILCHGYIKVLGNQQAGNFFSKIIFSRNSIHSPTSQCGSILHSSSHRSAKIIFPGLGTSYCS